MKGRRTIDLLHNALLFPTEGRHKQNSHIDLAKSGPDKSTEICGHVLLSGVRVFKLQLESCVFGKVNNCPSQRRCCKGALSLQSSPPVLGGQQEEDDCIRSGWLSGVQRDEAKSSHIR